VAEVDYEPIAATVDVLGKTLGDPLRRAGDGVSSALIGALPVGLVGKQRVDAQHDSTVCTSLAKAHGQLGELRGRQRDRVPDPGLARPAKRGIGHASHPEFDPPGSGEAGRQPAVGDREAPSWSIEPGICVKAERASSSQSSRSRPRRSNLEPRLSNSFSSQPAATAMTIRPSERKSRLVTCLSTTNGLRWGTMSAETPS
jgi:hypothetical protein